MCEGRADGTPRESPHGNTEPVICLGLALNCFRESSRQTRRINISSDEGCTIRAGPESKLRRIPENTKTLEFLDP